VLKFFFEFFTINILLFFETLPCALRAHISMTHKNLSINNHYKFIIIYKHKKILWKGNVQKFPKENVS